MRGQEERNPFEIDFPGSEEGEYEEEFPSSGRFTQLAEAVSLFLHPVIIPSIIFGIIFYLSPAVSAPLSEEARLPMLGLLVFSTFFVPLSWLMVLRYLGGMPSLKMMNRQERPVPFISIALFYAFVTYIFISKYPVYTNIIIVLTGITLILFLITIISLYWKISAHSTAICGAVGFLSAFTLLYQDLLLLFPLASLIVLAGASMSARLYLHVHTPLEVWVGAMLGFSVCFCVVFLSWIM